VAALVLMVTGFAQDASGDVDVTGTPFEGSGAYASKAPDSSDRDDEVTFFAIEQD
jgi:hypothetical protein